jgi:hypothetical protein
MKKVATNTARPVTIPQYPHDMTRTPEKWHAS